MHTPTSRSLKTWLAAIVAALAGLLLWTGCSAGSSDENVLPVGVILPLSGDLASFGTSTLAGIEFQIDQINQSGGLQGKQIELYVEDNKNDQTQCISAYKKLTGLKGVIAVIGPITSTNSLAIIEAVSSAKVPVISPTATNDQVAPKSDYMFRACFNDSFQGRVVAHYALNELGIERAAVMTELSSDYSIGLVNSFKKAFNEGGGEIVAEPSYQTKDTEFGPQLKQIKESGAQLVFVPGYPGEVPLILKQAEVMGIDATFSGADGWDHDDIIQKSGDKIVGAFFTGAFSPDDQSPTVQSFVNAMQAQSDRAPGSFEALGADSVTLLAEAIRAAGSTDPTAIRDALTKLQDVTAVTGPITMTPEGNAEKAAVIMGVAKDGDAYTKTYKATVKP